MLSVAKAFCRHPFHLSDATVDVDTVVVAPSVSSEVGAVFVTILLKVIVEDTTDEVAINRHHGHVGCAVLAHIEAADSSLESPAAVTEQCNEELVRVLIQHVAEPVVDAVAVGQRTVLHLRVRDTG